MSKAVLGKRTVSRAPCSEGVRARKAEAWERRVSDTSKAVLGKRTVSRAPCSEGVRARKAEAWERRVSDTSKAVWVKRIVSGAQCAKGEAGIRSVDNDGGSQNKRNAVVRKESSDTQ